MTDANKDPMRSSYDHFLKTADGREGNRNKKCNSRKVSLSLCNMLKPHAKK